MHFQRTLSISEKTLFFFILLAFASLTVEAQVVSAFETDNEGWTVKDLGGNNAQAVIYHSTGGNPGGYVSIAPVGCCSYYWNAPAKFLGDHCLQGYGMNLKFDLQLSATGAISGPSNPNGSVRLSGSNGITIVMEITSAPAVAPGWTTYSVTLDETTNWHNGNISGLVSSHNDIIGTLSNLTKIEIINQYAFGSDPEISIDNVVLEKATLNVPPAITTFTPLRGIPSSGSVTITGTNFNAVKTNNLVYFGGVAATVSSATTTQLVVTIPAGAAFDRITVFDKTTGLSASSITAFHPLFDNNKDYGGQIIRASMGQPIRLDTQTGTGWNETGDVDGDGRVDIIAGDGGVFKVWRNAGVAGSITDASFDPPVSFTITQPYSKGFTALADFDGDGKLDVVVSSASSFIAAVSVFRNISTPGVPKFEAPLIFNGVAYSDGPIVLGDLDGDGRIDIVTNFNNSCAVGDRLYIYANRSTPGNIDFCSIQQFGPVSTCGGSISLGDLNGDKKLDVIIEAGIITVFQNISTRGSIDMAAPFVLSTSAQGKALITDLDNDGKADLAWSFGTNQVEIRKNIHTTGALSVGSFAAPVSVKGTGVYGGEITATDINGDGRPDIVINGHTYLCIIENTSKAGVIDATSFVPGVLYSSGGTYTYSRSVRTADFDGDHKPDVIMRTTNASPNNYILVYHNESFPVPRIDSFTPLSANTGETVSLTGDYFKTGLSSDASLRFGLIKSTLNIAGNTNASSTVPNGASTDQINISDHGLIGSSKIFPVIFGTSRTLDASSFAGSVDFSVGANLREALSLADFDDDNKMDVIVIDNYSTTKIFKGTHATPGQPVTSSSLTLQATTYSGSNNNLPLDIDGDGKTDLNNGYGLLKNNSSGNISFAYGPTGVSTYAGNFTAATKAISTEMARSTS